MTTPIIAASGLWAEPMAAIHQACFGPAAWSAAGIATMFQAPQVFGYVSEAGGLIMARAVADEAEILTLGVIPSARRQGLARTLLDRTIAQSRARGAISMFLEVAAENTAAIVLYHRAAFEDCGRRRDYYGTGSDALVLRRSLCE